MQQSEGWVKWPFSLSKKQQLSIHSQDFNVFMADGRINERKIKSQRDKNPPQ